MSARTDRIEAVYVRALRLYPAAFRDAYAEAMRQSLRDALADTSFPRRKFVSLLLRDLATSLLKEHFAMIREAYARPALVFNALVLAGVSTVLALALYAIPQQVLRNGANDPQIQLATDAAARLENGAAPVEAIPAGDIDMARSLSPFVIAYDDQGRPLTSQAKLNGSVPVPPSGVFDYVRTHGEERVSWQPILGTVRGVRIAAVVERVGGAHPGFVLAGRSLREVEARENQVWHMASFAWMVMLALIVLASLAFGWMTRKTQTPAAV
jgi:hypothetical protein